MTLLALLLAAAQGSYAWNAEMPGETVQYGVAETDDRALRIDCHDGRIEILGPSGIDTAENVPTRVTFRRGAQSITVLGVTVAMGDGLNFAVPVGAGELPIATLLAGEPLTIEHGDARWEVPGAGAPTVLAPLVAGCRR